MAHLTVTFSLRIIPVLAQDGLQATYPKCADIYIEEKNIKKKTLAVKNIATLPKRIKLLVDLP